MDMEAAPGPALPRSSPVAVAPSLATTSSSVEPAAEAALAGAMSPPASQPRPADADADTPEAAATPQLPPAPHKALAGDSPSQRAGSESPCVTDAAAKLSLNSPGDQVRSLPEVRSFPAVRATSI